MIKQTDRNGREMGTGERWKRGGNEEGGKKRRCLGRWEDKDKGLRW
jgi:hypothetical protein